MSEQNYQNLTDHINQGAVEELSRLGYTPETLQNKLVYAIIKYIGEGKVDVRYSIVGKWNIKRILYTLDTNTIQL